jgi:hypothetical protein
MIRFPVPVRVLCAANRDAQVSSSEAAKQLGIGLGTLRASRSKKYIPENTLRWPHWFNQKQVQLLKELKPLFQEVRKATRKIERQPICPTMPSEANPSCSLCSPYGIGPDLPSVELSASIDKPIRWLQVKAMSMSANAC